MYNIHNNVQYTCTLELLPYVRLNERVYGNTSVNTIMMPQEHGGERATRLAEVSFEQYRGRHQPDGSLHGGVP